MKKILKKISGLKKEKPIDLRDEEEEILEEEEMDMDEEEMDEEELDENEEETEDEEDTEDEEYTEEDEDLDEEDKAWLEQNEYEEGQLSIDVYQTPDALIVKSTIAGVKPGDIDISINNDMLTIRGKREMTEEIKNDHYLFRECYWGSFSRSIILPVEIEADKIDACLENGVLTITLPKAKSAKQINIKVKEK